ncbi:hypothetical protein TURU_125746 [Turdus rufiventris]|nr:hypothetical protein TURU_125746 [Turdus rufiventris]
MPRVPVTATIARSASHSIHPQGPELLPKLQECQLQHPSPEARIAPQMPGVPVTASSGTRTAPHYARSASHGIHPQEPELLPTIPGVAVRASIPRGQDCSPLCQECHSQHPQGQDCSPNARSGSQSIHPQGQSRCPAWQHSPDVRYGAHLHSNRCSGSAAAQGEQQRQGCSVLSETPSKSQMVDELNKTIHQAKWYAFLIKLESGLLDFSVMAQKLMKKMKPLFLVLFVPACPCQVSAAGGRTQAVASSTMADVELNREKMVTHLPWKLCGSAFNREIKQNSKECKTSALGENGKVAVKSSKRQMFRAGEQNVHK